MIASGNPWQSAAAHDWKIIDASALDRDLDLEADVAIVGTGAGGGIAAEILAQSGLAVILIEEGPLATSRDFRMRESEAYPTLYQESAARKTRDKAIGILQGRCVGGGTTVNWTSSFRTPDTTLAYWRRAFGLAGFGTEDLAPWFARVETRLGIAPWNVPPNANNEALARGAAALGIQSAAIRRNVKSCWNLGYCGMGCPVDAKQSMLITTVPAALDRGATLVTRARALRFAHGGERVTALACAAMDTRGVAHDRAADLDPRARLRRGCGRDRHARPPFAKPRPGSARPRRQAHVPASDGRLRCSHARANRPVRRGAADDLLRPLSRFRSGRRPDRVQARSRPRASDADGDHPARDRDARMRSGCASCRICTLRSHFCATAFIRTARAAR